MVKEWLGRHSCRKKELQSLVGKLQHACRVVKPGRSFLRRVIELLAAVKRDFHHVRLNASFRSDLVWWDIHSWRGGMGPLFKRIVVTSTRPGSSSIQMHLGGSGVELIGIANGSSLSGQRVGVVTISRLRR